MFVQVECKTWWWHCSEPVDHFLNILQEPFSSHHELKNGSISKMACKQKLNFLPTARISRPLLAQSFLNKNLINLLYPKLSRTSLDPLPPKNHTSTFIMCKKYINIHVISHKNIIWKFEKQSQRKQQHIAIDSMKC